MNRAWRIYVAGHQGLVGSAVLRALKARGYGDVVTARRAELDLTCQRSVEKFFEAARPDAVILCAAKVGGILANSTRPAEFIRDNLLIQTLVIDAAFRVGVRKLVFLGSSCIYPRLTPQPIVEDALLTGLLEPTNEPYAVAKIAGLKMCQAYRRQYGFDAIVAMPTNLYGENDDFSDQDSHVLAALIARIHQARQSGADHVTVWGSGEPRREFLHADDCGDAIVHLLESYSAAEPINVGCGQDISIAELARLIARIIGFTGRIEFDRSKPDGTPRKLLDVSRLGALGWRPRIPLERGIEAVWRSYASGLRSTR
jgi:GDP-L-fucose synthase